MAIVVFMQWKGVTGEQYDALRTLVNWENEAPEGGIFHVAAIAEDGLRITDLWESVETYERFIENRLMPGVQHLGIPGEPDVEVYPVHRLFTPAFEPA